MNPKLNQGARLDAIEIHVRAPSPRGLYGSAEVEAILAVRLGGQEIERQPELKREACARGEGELGVSAFGRGVVVVNAAGGVAEAQAHVHQRAGLVGALRVEETRRDRDADQDKVASRPERPTHHMASAAR